MRLYSFVNANYLKHVQHGLQTAHAVAELYNKYPEDRPDGGCPLYDMLNDWARSHKTIVILDGGDCQDLKDIGLFLHQNDGLQLPYATFNEDERSLNGALTAVAVIVPRTIYDVRPKVNVNVPGFISLDPEALWSVPQQKFELDGEPYKWDNYAQRAFYDLLKSKSLAR